MHLATAAAAFGAGLAVTAPAALIAPLAQRMSEGMVVARATEGTLWRGSAAFFVREPGGRLQRLGRVSWAASPGWTGLRVRAGTGGGSADSGHMELLLGWRRVSVRSVDAELPAAMLGAAWPQLAAWQPGGRLRIRSDGMRIDAEGFLGAAEVEWRGARLLPTAALDLGTHAARLNGSGKALKIELVTLAGAPRLQGSGTWIPREKLDLSGTIEAPVHAGERLVAFLQGVCADFRDGRCSFKLSTTGL